MAPLAYVDQGIFDSVADTINSGLYSPDAADALSAGATVGPPESKGVIETTRMSVLHLHQGNPEGLQQAIRAIGEPCASRIQAIIDAANQREGAPAA